MSGVSIGLGGYQVQRTITATMTVSATLAKDQEILVTVVNPVAAGSCRWP